MLKKRNRLTWMKKHFHESAHVENCKAIDKSMDYCSKRDSRIDGPWFYPERIEKINDPLDGLALHAWQQEILETLKVKPDDRKVYWYWSKGGNKGKSMFAKHLVIKHEANLIAGGASRDIAHSLGSSPKIVLIDIARCATAVPYSSIENIKNGLLFSGKYESTVKMFNTPHVIIFANYEPDYIKLSEDRWVVKNID